MCMSVHTCVCMHVCVCMSEGGDAQITGIRCKDARVGGVFQYVFGLFVFVGI